MRPSCKTSTSPCARRRRRARNASSFAVRGRIGAYRIAKKRYAVTIFRDCDILMAHGIGTNSYAMSEETKRCPKCEQVLPVTRFSRRRLSLNSYCRSCQSICARNHYVANAAAYNARRLELQRRYYIRNRDFAIAFLRTHPCVDCGECDPVVLEFDHVDHLTKKLNVSDMIRQGFSLRRLQREIDLCVVRFVNCHRRRTAKQFAWDLN